VGDREAVGTMWVIHSRPILLTKHFVIRVVWGLYSLFRGMGLLVELPRDMSSQGCFPRRKLGE
jgi:hypothetical protein